MSAGSLAPSSCGPQPDAADAPIAQRCQTRQTLEAESGDTGAALPESPGNPFSGEATGELIAAVRGAVRRYSVVSPYQSLAVALWTLHSHAVDAAEATPYLAVTSAEKQSGKTRL